MGRPALLETFETLEKSGSAQSDVHPEPDDSWQSGFEAGYDKAVADMKDEQAHLSARIVQVLNDQAFAYHEARTYLEGTLRPLFDQLVATFVPHLAHAAFVPLVSATLQDMAGRLMDRPIQLRVAPGQEDVFRSLILKVHDFPLHLQSDDGLDDQQAILSGGNEEAVIDLRPLLEEIGSILGTMTTTGTEYSEHG